MAPKGRLGAWTHIIKDKKAKVQSYSEGQWVGPEPELARSILYYLHCLDPDNESQQRSDVTTFLVWADLNKMPETERNLKLFRKYIFLIFLLSIELSSYCCG